MDTNTYLYMVLVPVAEVFRSELHKGKAPMMAIRNSKSCRVKFTSKTLDKKWCKFCKENELKNDSDLEY